MCGGDQGGTVALLWGSAADDKREKEVDWNSDSYAVINAKCTQTGGCCYKDGTLCLFCGFFIADQWMDGMRHVPA